MSIKKKITTFIYRLVIVFWKINPVKLYTRNVLLFLHIPVKKTYQDLRYQGSFYVKIGSGAFNLYNPGYTTIENEIFWLGLDTGWERGSRHLWENLCMQSEVIFDIGANTGIYSLVACAANPDAQVYAFEPGKSTFPLLKKNKDINKFNNLFLNELAISNSERTAVFYDFVHLADYNASLDPTFNLHRPGDAAKTYDVQVVSLDYFIKTNSIKGCSLVKIDVELHEPEVLEGMQQTLLQYKPTLLIEILNEQVGKKVQDMLAGVDYLFFSINESSEPAQVKAFSEHDGYNYLICRKEIAQSLGLTVK